jgi:hypothetical protein
MELAIPSQMPPRSSNGVASEAAGALGVVLQRVGTLAIWLVVWLPFYGLPLLVLWLLRHRLAALARPPAR